MRGLADLGLAARGALALALAACLCGCSEELGPARRETARARGTVREGARPISGGWIEFFPVDGTVGNLRSARLRDDGTFEADGVAVGVNLVRFENVAIQAPLAARLFRSYQSPIRRAVVSERGRGSAGPQTIDINLLDELVDHQGPSSRPRPVTAATAAPAAPAAPETEAPR